MSFWVQENNSCFLVRHSEGLDLWTYEFPTNPSLKILKFIATKYFFPHHFPVDFPAGAAPLILTQPMHAATAKAAHADPVARYMTLSNVSL